MIRSKQQITATILLITTMSLTNSPARSAAVLSSQSSQKTELKLRDRWLSQPEGKSDLLNMALIAASQGDRLKLAKMYKLSLLAEQNSGSERFHTSLQTALLATHESAKQCYRDGNVSEGIERLRLYFNLLAQLSKHDYRESTNEADGWFAAAKIMALPKEDCIGAISDYGFFLNCSGQYKLAVPVLKAVVRESPERAAAYLCLADAEWYSGNHSQGNANYQNYHRYMAMHKNAGQSLSNACLTRARSNGSADAAIANEPLQQDMVAVLSTEGRLIDPGRPFKFRSEIDGIFAHQTPSIALKPTADLPWLEDFYQNATQPKSLTALTDETTHSKRPIHQTTKHTALPSSLQQCIDLNDEAILALQDRQPEDAIKTLNEALQVDPGCLLTLENLAVAFNNMAIEKSDQPKVALKAFHQAMALAPLSQTVRTNTNALLMRIGKDPYSFPTRLALARESLEHGDYLGALVEYREAQRLKVDLQVKDMIVALTQQIAVEELTPQAQLSASLDWKHTIDAGRFGHSTVSSAQ